MRSQPALIFSAREPVHAMAGSIPWAHHSKRQAFTTNDLDFLLTHPLYLFPIYSYQIASCSIYPSVRLVVIEYPNPSQTLVFHINPIYQFHDPTNRSPYVLYAFNPSH